MRNAESGRAVLKELLIGPRSPQKFDERRRRYRFTGRSRSIGSSPVYLS
jgi:hypothetical protein